MTAALLRFEAALALVLGKAHTLGVFPPVERVSLEEAPGRVLAEHVLADRDQPPFPRSTRDGYAVRAADTGERHIVGAIRAGEAWPGPALRRGEALEIMTGAALPEGADAVLMVEHASVSHGPTDVDLLRLQEGRTPPAAGANVVPRAAEAQASEAVLRAGTRMGAAEIALAASVGAAGVPVYARPMAAIVATGDELVALDEVPGPMQIRNSNSHGLAALVRANGGAAEVLSPALDTRESVRDRITAARGAAMLLLSGGVSAGRYDFVEDVLLSLGAEFYFTGVQMQPGKPVVFGRIPADESHGEQWVFGLPGNPVSTQVTATVFAMPLLRALGGEREATPEFVQATLVEDLFVKPGPTKLLPARIESTVAGAVVRATGWQGSGDLHSNARANCYVVVPPERESVAVGEVLTVLLR